MISSSLHSCLRQERKSKLAPEEKEAAHRSSQMWVKTDLTGSFLEMSQPPYGLGSLFFKRLLGCSLE